MHQGQQTLLQTTQPLCKGVAQSCKHGSDHPGVQCGALILVQGWLPQTVIRQAWVRDVAAQDLEPALQCLHSHTYTESAIEHQMLQQTS